MNNTKIPLLGILLGIISIWIAITCFIFSISIFFIWHCSGSCSVIPFLLMFLWFFPLWILYSYMSVGLFKWSKNKIFKKWFIYLVFLPVFLLWIYFIILFSYDLRNGISRIQIANNPTSEYIYADKNPNWRNDFKMWGSKDINSSTLKITLILLLFVILYLITRKTTKNIYYN